MERTYQARVSKSANDLNQKDFEKAKGFHQKAFITYSGVNPAR